MSTFIRRAPWWLVALWLVTATALALNAYVGEWVAVASLACIGLLSVFSEALFQQLVDVRRERDDLAALSAKLGKRLVDADLRFYARNPRADWEG
jgi:hypothetical protein